MNNFTAKKKRPLSHKPLVNFPKDDNFLYSDQKFMNEELWKRKYNLSNLHEKWKRKAQINFLNIDFKFGIKKKKKNTTNIYELNKRNINLSSKNSVSLYSEFFTQKKQKKYYDKYDDKVSYYLNNKNPWNSGTTIDVNKSKKILKCSSKNNFMQMKDIIKKNEESKNIKVTCSYYNNNYLEKLQKMKNLKDKFATEIKEEIIKKYDITNLKVFEKMKSKFYLFFKELLKKYLELYYKINSNEIKEKQLIFEKLFLIVNLLEENRSKINNKEEFDNLSKAYSDVMEKNDILKNNNLEYISFFAKYLKTDVKYNSSRNKKLNIYKNMNKRKNNSFSNFRINKKKHLFEYKITYYHPGTYFLFNNDNNQFHAWSCCINENKGAKGCCKKIERVQIFNYDKI